MIKLYSGTPGSGKSFHLAVVMWDRLRNGKAVIANFPINYNLVKGRRASIGAFTYLDMSEALR